MKEEELARELLSKYKARLKKELGGITEKPKVIPRAKVISQEYREFKKSFFPKPMSFYEKACNFSEKIAKIKPQAKKKAELRRSIKICHLEMTPEGAYSFAIFLPVFSSVIGSNFFFYNIRFIIFCDILCNGGFGFDLSFDADA